MKKLVYLDNASTTPVSKHALNKMLPFFNLNFANPSSLHSLGVVAKSAVENSRIMIASALNTQPDTIIFTSGGTEANNLAIFGTCEANNSKKHVITAATEHSSVLEPLNKLKNLGWKITVLPVNKDGFINPEEVINTITPDTVLVSIMLANNEIGTIQNISEIGNRITKFKKNTNSNYPYFHSDACQAPGYIKLNVEKLHVDLLTINSSKIYGPKGIGALYKKRGLEINPQIVGGDQENNFRSGTENVAAIVGFSEALEIAQKNTHAETKKALRLSEYFYKKISKVYPEADLNGPKLGSVRLPNNLNIYFPGIDGEQLVLYLDSFGIACSTASACTTNKGERSHVLRSLGFDEQRTISSVRFSLGVNTTKSDLDYTIKCLQKVLKLLSV